MTDYDHLITPELVVKTIEEIVDDQAKDSKLWELVVGAHSWFSVYIDNDSIHLTWSDDVCLDYGDALPELMVEFEYFGYQALEILLRTLNVEVGEV